MKKFFVLVLILFTIIITGCGENPQATINSDQPNGEEYGGVSMSFASAAALGIETCDAYFYRYVSDPSGEGGYYFHKEVHLNLADSATLIVHLSWNQYQVQVNCGEYYGEATFQVRNGIVPVTVNMMPTGAALEIVFPEEPVASLTKHSTTPSGLIGSGLQSVLRFTVTNTTDVPLEIQNLRVEIEAEDSLFSDWACLEEIGNTGTLPLNVYNVNDLSTRVGLGANDTKHVVEGCDGGASGIDVIEVSLSFYELVVIDTGSSETFEVQMEIEGAASTGDAFRVNLVNHDVPGSYGCVVSSGYPFPCVMLRAPTYVYYYGAKVAPTFPVNGNWLIAQ